MTDAQSTDPKTPDMSDSKLAPPSAHPIPEGVDTHGISFREAFWVWVKVAIYSFGGPAGQIAVMHQLLVEKKQWVSENRFLHALNYCMLLPGPEAQQLATYIGWLLHKVKGGLVAGLLFVLPGFVSILILSVLYAGFQGVSTVQALFYGIKPAVMAIVAEAVWRIGQRALKNKVMVGLAALSFIAIFVFDVPFPLIILSAGLIGYLGGKAWEEKFYVIKGQDTQGEDPSMALITDEMASMKERPSWRHLLRTGGTWLAIWWIPVIALGAILGLSHIFVQEGVFFSKTAVVTFGGAYAVLAYIAQQAVDVYGWLQPGEMLDGLGLAETTPGPLIQVVQFVGFMGAYRNPGVLDPMVAGVIGSVVTTWVTFAPCFLWIFLGAPYIEYLRGKKALTTALSGITAAVVGVVLNLAVWFSFHTAFGTVETITSFGMELSVPVWPTVDWAAVGLGAVAFYVVFWREWDMLQTIGLGAGLGMIYYLTVLA